MNETQKDEKGVPRVNQRPKHSPSPVLRLGMAAMWIGVMGCTGQDLNPASSFYSAPRVAPLGALSDSVWVAQEGEAEASKFVIYDHEFKLNTTRLNTAGEDHLKKIAARLHEGTPFPVVVERSMNGRSRGEYHYPVSPNPDLDNERRDVVIAGLKLMGVEDADVRVVVAPATAEAGTSTEAESAYLNGLQGGSSTNGFTGGFGGFGGGGVF